MKAILSELHNMSLLSAELPVTFVPFRCTASFGSERCSGGRSSLNKAEQQSVTMTPLYTSLISSLDTHGRPLLTWCLKDKRLKNLLTSNAPGLRGSPGLLLSPSLTTFPLAIAALRLMLFTIRAPGSDSGVGLEDTVM